MNKFYFIKCDPERDNRMRQVKRGHRKPDQNDLKGAIYVSKEDILKYVHLPQKEAAEILGKCCT
jgi:hypothetical protein